MIEPIPSATPDPASENPLAAMQRLLLLHDADRREYLAGLDAAARRAGRTRSPIEVWIDEIPFHNRQLDLSSVTGKRTILGDGAPLISNVNLLQETPWEGGGGWGQGEGDTGDTGVGVRGSWFDSPNFVNKPSGDIPRPQTTVSPGSGARPIPAEPSPSPGPPQRLAPTPASPQSPQTPPAPKPSKPTLPPAPILNPENELPEGELPPAVAGQNNSQPQHIKPLPITPDQTRLGGSGGPASGTAPASSSTSSGAAQTSASQSGDAKADAEQGVKPQPKPAYQPVNQTDVPQDRVRVMRDGAAVELPRDQVSEGEIAAVTAPPPAPFKEPRPGEAASFTGQALRDHFTIPDHIGLVHQEMAAQSIGAWVSAALQNHQPVTATVNGQPRTIVAVDAGNMLLDSKGMAIDPYRLVFGDPNATVLEIGPSARAEEVKDATAAGLAPGVEAPTATEPVAADAPGLSAADLPDAVDESKSDGSKTWVIGADEPAGWAKLAPTAVKQEKRKTYIFDIDSLDRTIRAKGLLVLDRTQGRNTQNQAEAGGTDRRETDQGGHAIPRVFGGPTEKFNHLAQNKNFNKSAYLTLTNVWVKAVEAGKKVYLDIAFQYEGNSQRPHSWS